MKYGRSLVCYTDKHLNLISFDKVFNRSGHAHLKKNISVKKCESLNNGRTARNIGLTDLERPERNKRRER